MKNYDYDVGITVIIHNVPSLFHEQPYLLIELDEFLASKSGR